MPRYHYRVGNRTFGPVDGKTLKERLRSGTLDAAKTSVREDGKESWIPASKLRFASSQSAIKVLPSAPTVEQVAVDTPTDVPIQDEWREPTSTFKPFEIPSSLASPPARDHRVPTKFPITRVLISMLRIAALICLGIGLLAAAIAIIRGPSELVTLLGAFAFIAVGFLAMCAILLIAESIQVILDIEHNQRIQTGVLIAMLDKQAHRDH